MALDARLECLKEAILQEWEGLEVSESGRSIIVRLKWRKNYSE